MATSPLGQVLLQLLKYLTDNKISSSRNIQVVQFEEENPECRAFECTVSGLYTVRLANDTVYETFCFAGQEKPHRIVEVVDGPRLGNFAPSPEETLQGITAVTRLNTLQFLY